jgi:Xaa-Pro aminopeptidase
LRAVKSPEELDKMRTANRVGEQAFRDIAPMIRDGVAYSAVANAWAKAVIDHGAFPIWMQPFDFIGQQTPVLPAQSPTLARYPTHVQKGVMTRLDIGCCYKGYYSDQKIVLCPGQPSAEAVEIYHSHRARQEFMRSTLRPGMTKAQAYAAFVQGFEDLDRHPFWFHGVGLDYHEEPRFGTLYAHAVQLMPELVFEANNVLALELSWLVEDTYILRADGCECLSELPQQIMIL